MTYDVISGLKDTGLCVGGPLDHKQYAAPPRANYFCVAEAPEPDMALSTPDLSAPLRQKSHLKQHRYLAERIGRCIFWRHESLSTDQVVEALLAHYRS